MQLVTITEISERLCISRATVWRYRKRFGDFPEPILLNGVNPRWILSELEEWIIAHRQHRS